MLEINLSGRHALVTGGSRGIGAGVTLALGKCNADVAFTYKSDVDAATRICDELDGFNVKNTAIQADAVSESAMTNAVNKAAEQLGAIDILVINVGMNAVVPLDDLSYDEWKKGIDLNLNSVYLAIKSASPFIKKSQRGDIILIGSSGVFDGGGGTPYYAAAKAGMVGLMRYLMRELPQENIHINTIHPCVVDTDLLRSRYDTDEKIDKLASQVPLGRLSVPADIGNLTAFLCSGLGGFICGQSILVDGGRTFWKKS